MSNKTSIQLTKSSLELLKKHKTHPRETYEEIITRLMIFFDNNQHKSEYDQFLHKIQQLKMQELWDNEDDDAWEHY